MWVLASQTWASANIEETNQPISVTGLEAFPQLTISLVIWLLIAFVSGYLKSLFPRFLLSAISVFNLAIQAPVLFESAGGSLSVLSSAITRLTGVSGWDSQEVLITNGEYGHFVADLFIVLLLVCFMATVTRIWLKSTFRNEKALVTRIDDLPKW